MEFVDQADVLDLRPTISSGCDHHPLTSHDSSLSSRDGTSGEVFFEPAEDDLPRIRGAAGLAGIPPVPDMDRHDYLLAMRAGRIGSLHSWELVTAVDGPGTRITVFLNGCPLRCQYCHNPDTFQMREGTPVMADDLLAHIKRYKAIFKASKGGVTFSGGEALMQPRFLEYLLAGCREAGIHTTVDTSGYLGSNVSETMLNTIDLVLLDVKSGDPATYQHVTGRPLAPTLAFGDRLAAAGIPMWIRFVLVPGLTDDEANIARVADIAAGWKTVERVEVLPFHKMGEDKWRELGLAYQLADTPAPSKTQTEAARAIFADRGLQVF